MNLILSKLLTRANDLAEVEPLIALFLGASLLAVFLTALLQNPSAGAADGKNSSLLWTLYKNFTRLTWALLLVALLAGTVSVLRSYLHGRSTISSGRTVASRRRITTPCKQSGARNKSRAN